MDRPAYEIDAYLTVLDTEVIEVGEEGGTPFAVTADTIFYPEGGGQPADRGTLGGVAVVDVRKSGDAIRHVLASPASPGPTRLELEWPRRYDHMQQHTAQHILTTVAQRDFGWPTLAFHLGPTVSDIELDVAALDRASLTDLEDAAMAEIREARPISVRSARPDQMDELGVRSRLLPAGFEGTLRLVEIDGLDLNTCGGTHVGNTAEIGTVAITGTEPMRGGTRVFWVAGDRVRRRLAEHEARNHRLRSLLDTADVELPDVMALRLDREKALAGENRRLKAELAAAVADSLLAGSTGVMTGHWEQRDMAFLQELAKLLVDRAPDRVALLAAGPRNDGSFVVVVAEETKLDLAETGARVAAILGGRGGGRPPFFQGKATDLGRFDEAVASLRNELKVQS
jgi:alanyl-tRNA synthetase